MGVSPPPCHSEEPQATWESRRAKCACPPKQRFSRRVHSTLLRMTGRNKCHSERSEESGWGRQDLRQCHSEEPQATWESRRAKCACPPKQRFSRRVHSTLLRMTGWAYQSRISSTTRFFTPLRYVQNDTTHGIASQESCALFRQKRLVATRNENWVDGLYLTYCPFTQSSERKQMAAFHGKPPKNHQPTFSSKAVLYHANEDPPDRLYLAYYLFGGASARQ